MLRFAGRNTSEGILSPALSDLAGCIDALNGGDGLQAGGIHSNLESANKCRCMSLLSAFLLPGALHTWLFLSLQAHSQLRTQVRATCIDRRIARLQVVP